MGKDIDVTPKFIHPSEIGIDTPIWTREQQDNVARALNGIPSKPMIDMQKKERENHERREYLRLKEKYGK